MRFVLLIYGNEADWEHASDSEKETTMRGHGRLEADLRASGQFRACDALMPVRSAATVRVRAGRALVTDEPYAETKEQLGGFYVVDAKDLAEAIAIATRIPTTESGSVEVRPVHELDMAPYAPERANSA